MSFDKNYPNRKDRRKRYYKSKAFDRSCRPHGGCPYCESNRMHRNKKRMDAAENKINEWKG